MNLPLKIAKRYLIAKKSHNIINVISLISVIGVFVGSMALIIVLSVFNGFGNLILQLYDSFDPDIKIIAAQGKFFDPSLIDLKKIKNINGVDAICLTLEENALIKNDDRQCIATIKGVDSNFIHTSRITENIIDGNFSLSDAEIPSASVGSVIAYTLSLNLVATFNALTIYVPKKDASLTNIAQDAFYEKIIQPTSVFGIQQDFDSKYVLVPLQFAREITGEEKRVSAIEISILVNADTKNIINQINAIAGKNFLVKDRIQQHDFIYKILKSEKFAVFLILSLIMIIAIFNILGTLTILIIEKKRDIGILKNLGATLQTVKGIFFIEGILITAIGAVAGIVCGLLICYAQIHFSIIKFSNQGAMVVDAYPVMIQWLDVVCVLLTVGGVGMLATLFTTEKLVRKLY
ncbi:MAG: FtsX-like permease family protein [Bacteroidetes bacterium]|nr:FtsX-like permease family protein [Bacteroidota bacterium]